VTEDVLKDFDVMVEFSDGKLRTFRPEEFRHLARCPSRLLLSTCVEWYNTKMKRDGIGEHAQLVPRKKR